MNVFSGYTVVPQLVLATLYLIANLYQMYKLIYIIFLVLMMIGQSSAQPYYFKHYQVENGLSNNAVICSLQDKQGFLWFGTKDGLNRFNGYTFKTFRSDAGETGSIGNNFIHSLHEDEKGTLWAGTESGLYEYNATTESFTLLLTTLYGQIREITSYKDNLWFISGFTLACYNVATKQLKYYDVPYYFEAISLCISNDGIVWVATSGGMLKKYNPTSDTFSETNVFIHSKQTVSKWIEKVYATTENSILIGTSNQGIKIYDIATASYRDVEIKEYKTTELFVRNFLQLSPNEYWIATESGIFIFNSKTNQFINLSKKSNDPYSISDNAVYTFCKDKEGGIWAGTYFGGINYYPKQFTAFKKYFPKAGENSLSGNVVREVRQDNKGMLWIGTEDAGLNMLNPATGIFTNMLPTGNKGSISYANIHGLLATGNELWIGTFEHGLDVLDINTKKVIRHYASGTNGHSLNSNFIYCIYQLPSGEIALGTTKGAFIYNRSTDDFSPVKGLPLNNWYSSILKNESGIIWAGTYGNGVHYYNTKTGESRNFRYNANNKNSLSSDRINSIYEDSNHNIWIATEGGLCKYLQQTNKFKTFTTKNGLPTNYILSILEDRKKDLWISTSKGLVCFNPVKEKIQIYTRANGILNDQFNFSSAFKDSSGRMYFGSVKGLISFHPDEFTQNTYTPPVYITGIQVNNDDINIASQGSPLSKSITFTNEITLQHNQSTFSIDFAALSYTAPEMTEYAYMMEGLDVDWNYLKRNRKVYFTDLASGDYTFKVKAAASSGVWNAQETTLNIKILPPFWRSNWAYMLYVLILIFIIYIIIRNYHKKVEEKNRRKMEQLKIAKEKEIFQAKIEFFTNVAHEIKTPLTLIKGPLEKVMRKSADIPDIKDSLKIMERNTNRLIDLTNQLLDFRQTEINGFSLNFIRINIIEVLEDMFAGFKPIAEQKKLQFAMRLPAKTLYASVDVDAFNKILSNLFSNAIKYAESKVLIILNESSKNNTSFTLEIKNDGYLIPFEMRDKIFEPFFRLKETEKQKGTGIGLALSLSLVQLHKGFLQILPSEKDMNVFSLILPLLQETELNKVIIQQKEIELTEINNNQ